MTTETRAGSSTRNSTGDALSFLARGAVIGLVYGLARSAAHVVAVAFGAPPFDEPVLAFALEFAAGLLVGLSLGAVARVLRGSSQRRLIALSTVFFLSVLAAMIEGAAFAPELQPPAVLPLGATLQFGVAIITAFAFVRLFAVKGTFPNMPEVPDVPRRPGWSWLWRYLVSALTYVVLYFMTGAINYALVTAPYYETHTSGLVLPAPTVVLGVATLEGGLLTLAVLPLLCGFGDLVLEPQTVAPSAHIVLCTIALVPRASTDEFPSKMRVSPR